MALGCLGPSIPRFPRSTIARASSVRQFDATITSTCARLSLRCRPRRTQFWQRMMISLDMLLSSHCRERGDTQRARRGHPSTMPRVAPQAQRTGGGGNVTRAAAAVGSLRGSNFTACTCATATILPRNINCCGIRCTDGFCQLLSKLSGRTTTPQGQRQGSPLKQFRRRELRSEKSMAASPCYSIKGSSSDRQDVHEGSQARESPHKAI